MDGRVACGKHPSATAGVRSMHLIEELRREHELIDPVIGSLKTFVHERVRGAGDPLDGQRFLTFFRVFVGRFHHAREEEQLFRALVENAELPRWRGPVARLHDDHEKLGLMLRQIAPHLSRLPDCAEEVIAFSELAERFCRSLWLHIDVENSVLFCEGEERLRRAGVVELPSRPATKEEDSARRIGEALLLSYPPTSDPDLVRGEQCVICPHFGGGCDGIEREWWGESEWEEFPHRVG